jgi:hypothetical protein
MIDASALQILPICAAAPRLKHFRRHAATSGVAQSKRRQRVAKNATWH